MFSINEPQKKLYFIGHKPLWIRHLCGIIYGMKVLPYPSLSNPEVLLYKTIMRTLYWFFIHSIRVFLDWLFGVKR